MDIELTPEEIELRAEHFKMREQLGMKIGVTRIKRTLSQKQLGDKIGVSNAYISRIERAEVGVSVERLYDIAKALGVSMSYLLDFTDLEI